MAVNSTVAGADGVAGIEMISHPLNVGMRFRLNSGDSGKSVKERQTESFGLESSQIKRNAV